MTNEIGQKNLRKLNYFFENKILIHFKDLSGIWFNGEIVDLSESKLVMVLNERKKGTIPIMLEDIETNSIVEFREAKLL